MTLFLLTASLSVSLSLSTVMSLQRTLSINAISEGIISMRFISYSGNRQLLPSYTKLWTPFHEEEKDDKSYFIDSQNTILIRENKEGIMQRVFYPPWTRIRKSPSPLPPSSELD